jgi:4-alpha-glucanotransferase
MPEVVAGVPPDLFSATGQRWGNPHYRWEREAADKFSFWKRRMRRTFELYDIVRIDHFRGFEAAWEIPAGEPTAMHGRWEPGPGSALFDALGEELGDLPIVVEDLGVITDEVRALRDGLGFPGMLVLQFAFDGGEGNPYRPANHPVNAVVYPGTHDNDTTVGWWRKASGAERHAARQLTGRGFRQPARDLVRAAFASPASLAIATMQDLLELGSEARMNTPGTPDGNWAWRFGWEVVPEGLRQRLQRWIVSSGRA